MNLNVRKAYNIINTSFAIHTSDHIWRTKHINLNIGNRKGGRIKGKGEGKREGQERRDGEKRRRKRKYKGRGKGERRRRCVFTFVGAKSRPWYSNQRFCSNANSDSAPSY